MTDRLKAQIAAMTPQPAPREAPSARDLLHAVLETADIERFHDDGSARLVLDVPPKLLDELAEWDCEEFENEEAE